MCGIIGPAAVLLSTRIAICIGSDAGTTRSTSRATLSSRTMKSDGPMLGTGAPDLSSMLTYKERSSAWDRSSDETLTTTAATSDTPTSKYRFIAPV